MNEKVGNFLPQGQQMDQNFFVKLQSLKYYWANTFIRFEFSLMRSAPESKTIVSFAQYDRSYLFALNPLNLTFHGPEPTTGTQRVFSLIGSGKML